MKRTRPPYAELAVLAETGQHHAWELHGRDDELGAVGWLSEETTVRAAQLVRSGRRIPLNLPLDQPDPPFFARKAYRHEVIRMSRIGFDDRLDGFYLQGSTQWDALCHVAHPVAGFYNDRSPEDIEQGALGIDNIARSPIVARGVLLDVARWAGANDVHMPGDARFEITPEIAQRVARDQGVTFEPGDVWCVRTGWLAWYLGADPATREVTAQATRERTFLEPGLAPGNRWAELLWDSGAVAVAVDNPAVEAMPVPKEASKAGDSLHGAVLALLGIPLGELFDFEALAEACAAEARYDFCFVSVPLHVPGGIGSPPNAVAVL